MTPAQLYHLNAVELEARGKPRHHRVDRRCRPRLVNGVSADLLEFKSWA